MVSINLTLLIQLALFLVFLGVTNRYFLRPVLRAMDTREEKIVQDEKQAGELNEEAERLDIYFARELSSARRIAAERVEKARRQAMEKRWETLGQHKEKTDKEVEKVRRNLQDDVARQRKNYDELLPAIVRSIDNRLRAGGGRLN